MSVRQKAKILADADTTAQKIPLDSSDINSDWVMFLFQGDNSEDLELVGDSAQDSGYPIEAGTRFISGPHRRDSDFPSVYLWAAQTDSVTVKVAEANEHNNFRHAPVTDNRDIDDITADIGVEGEHNATAPSLADGDEDQFQLDDKARLITILEKAFASVAQESIQNIEQEVVESFEVALLGTGLGPKRYVGNPAAAEHTVTSNASRLYALEGFVPDGQGNNNEDYLQIWDGDPSGTGSFVTSAPFRPSSSGADAVPSYTPPKGEDLPDGCYIVISQDPVAYNPVSYSGHIFARYVD